jgi:hypothetical protein
MMPSLMIILVGMLTLLPAANALAQRPAVRAVVILKCSEDNNDDSESSGEPVVHTCQDTSPTAGIYCQNAACETDDPCAPCLLHLTQTPRLCGGESIFTSNVVVSQQSDPQEDAGEGETDSIVTYTFACQQP